MTPFSSRTVEVTTEAAATLKPTTLSITGDEKAGITVNTCVLRGPLQKKLEMSLTVDPTTAEEFAQACRRQARWERTILPGVLVAAGLVAATGIVGTVRHDPGLVRVALPLMIVLASFIRIGRIALAVLRSPRHPRLKGRHTVLIRDVDREAAHEWVRLNSSEVIHTLG